jgi:hypothetical protein
VARRLLIEVRRAVRGGVDDRVDATERRGRLGEQALDVEVVPPAARISPTDASAAL